jgi:hypothetical protein
MADKVDDAHVLISFCGRSGFSLIVFRFFPGQIRCGFSGSGLLEAILAGSGFEVKKKANVRYIFVAIRFGLILMEIELGDQGESIWEERMADPSSPKLRRAGKRPWHPFSEW